MAASRPATGTVSKQALLFVAYLVELLRLTAIYRLLVYSKRLTIIGIVIVNLLGEVLFYF